MNYSQIFNNKPGLIFDFDGTIAKIQIDWMKWHTGMLSIFKEFEPTIDLDGHVHTYVNGMIKLYGNNIRSKILQFNEKYEFENSSGLTINEGLLDYIKTIEGKSLYLLTSNSKRFIKKSLKELSISGLFKEMITREDVNFIKPDTEGISKIIKNERKEKFIMIGDSPSDEETARSFGVDFYKVAID